MPLLELVGIIAYIREEPEALDALSPFDFQIITAELLASQGFEVNLNHSSARRGYDLLAVARDPLGLDSNWLVACKHFRQRRKIGVGSILSLIEMRLSLGTANALLVTSSSLTDEAERAARSLGVRIAERGAFLNWIAEYKPQFDNNAYVPQKAFESCFVSYSHKDGEFAEYFVEWLRRAGIRVWFAAEDLLPGKKINEEVAAAIGSFDRLLVILSENSMKSEWVKNEIRRARKREVVENRRILYPVSLQRFDYFRNWELFDADLGQDLAVELREYLIPDFTNWREPEHFDKVFGKVVAGLQSK